MADLPKCVEERLAALKKQREKALALSPAAKFAENLVDHLSLPQGNVSLNMVANTVDIFFTMRKPSEATPVLRELSRNGFRQSKKPLDVGDLQLRIWRCGQIRLEGQFPHTEGEHCRYVKVGVKEVPVYELRCPEQGKEAAHEREKNEEPVRPDPASR